MFKKIFAFLLINILLMSLAMLNPDSVFASAENNNLLPTVDSFRASTYTRVLSEWQKSFSVITENEYTFLQVN